MKKFLLLAFAACLTFATQAVTLQWTDQSDNYNAAGTRIKDESTNASVGKYSLAVLLTYNSVPSSTLTVAEIQQWDSGSSFIYAYGSDNATFSGMLGPEKKGSGGEKWADTTDGLPRPGEEALVIFTWQDNPNGSLTVTGWVNGVSWEMTTDAGRGASNLNLIVNSNDAWTIKEIAAYEGLLSSDEIAKMAANNTANIFSVPEPTALALLALGVAGLALRRKMA